jgi:uridine kinase
MSIAPAPLVLIAGGSGSGKTTLANGLIARFPAWTLIHLDDYQKPKEDVPRFLGHRNWDDPRAVDFDKLIMDLQALRRGEAVTVMARSQTEPVEHGMPKKVVPGPVIVLEGYLSLWHQEIRKMAAFSVFLNVSKEIRHARRRWRKSEDYIEQVLEPMHQRHIEPTSAYADLLLIAGANTPESVLEVVTHALSSYI